LLQKTAAYGFCFVTAETVDDDNIARLESWHEYLLDVSEEAVAIDRTIDQTARVDTIRSARLPGTSVSATAPV
jgi:hypothetical protein